MQSPSKSQQNSERNFGDRVVDFAKGIPFVYFVVGGTAVAIVMAFVLFVIQVYILLDGWQSGFTVIGIMTPLLTASVCFYFTALIIQKLKAAESSLESHNTALQEQIDLEIQKSRRKEQLLMQQSKMAMMGEMMGAVAHQWRQPLNALGLMIQDIRDARTYGELTDEYIKKVVEDSMSRIQFMSKTIDDFRNFFSPTADKLEFCVEDAIDSTLQIVFPQLANCGISATFHRADRHEYNGYQGEFQQVILNVIINAKDAILQTNPTEKKISIEITSDEKNIYIAIEDTGGGVSPKVIDRIFEPYFTTKEQGKGIGIGLYMSKQIVQRHLQGDMGVENIDDGARFTVSLPRGCLQ